MSRLISELVAGLMGELISQLIWELISGLMRGLMGELVPTLMGELMGQPGLPAQLPWEISGGHDPRKRELSRAARSHGAPGTSYAGAGDTSATRPSRRSVDVSPLWDCPRFP